MSNDQLQRQIDIIVENQARFSEDMLMLKDALLSLTNIVEGHDQQIAALIEQGRETDRRIAAITEQGRETDKRIAAMTERGRENDRRLDERLAELASLNKESDDRLNSLIILFERHLTEDHGKDRS